ncbi:MAG: MBL fold metallo-hydrolase [Chloroflexota bacterium]|nr:MBL fold metallo-hydrolase [Chloroflexota bacterium]
MRIKVLGAHMFESKDTRLSSILIDDILVIDAGGLTSGLTFTEQDRIEFILLTHGHYDHIRDVPAIALKNQHRTIGVYATQFTLDILTAHLINGTVYPRFTEWPSPQKPALKLKTLEPYQTVDIGGYSVTPVAVSHALEAVGYQIADKYGQRIFFSGDTGAGLASCWEYISPQIIIMDMSFSNESIDLTSGSGHLCPSLLREELDSFQQIKGYLPKVIMTHLNPDVESEIRDEARQLAHELGIEIALAYEGMVIT